MIKKIKLILFILLMMALAGGMVWLAISNVRLTEKNCVQAEINSAQADLINLQEAYINEIELRLEAKYSRVVTVTAYCENEDKTAIGEAPAPGTCAVAENLPE